jgi:hypothetical protein
VRQDLRPDLHVRLRDRTARMPNQTPPSARILLLLLAESADSTHSALCRISNLRPINAY